MAVYTVYDDGNRLEDVQLFITILTPTDTPFYSGTPKTKAGNVLHQWPEETLSTRQDNAQVEGGSYSYAKETAPSRVINITQIFEKTYAISSSQMWVKSAGIKDKFLHAQKKRLKELVTDIEHALLRGSINSGNDSVARRLGGALNFISTNLTAVNSGDKLTESFFNGLAQLVWNQGGDPDEAYVSGMLKRVVSAYTAGLTKYIGADDKRLVNTISMYENDFGLMKIIKSRDMPVGTNASMCLVVTSTSWKVAIGEPVHVLPEAEVAQTIRGKQGVIRGELTLEVLGQSHNALATGLQNLFN